MLNLFQHPTCLVGELANYAFYLCGGMNVNGIFNPLHCFVPCNDVWGMAPEYCPLHLASIFCSPFRGLGANAPQNFPYACPFESCSISKTAKAE